MRTTRTRLAAACAAVLLCLVAAASAQAARTITGLGGQGDNYAWGAGGDTYAASMGAKYQHDRYIVPWDVALRPGSADWLHMDAWYRSRKAQGKRLLVSFNHSENRCRELVAADPTIRSCFPLPPSVSDYTAAITAFRTTWRGVADFTAWNEPNHSAFGDGFVGGVWREDSYQMNPLDSLATQAADYFTALVTECRSDRGEGTCTPIAGDFSDGSGSMGAYPTTYKNRLTATSTAAPRWAVHAYSAVNSGSTRWIEDFFSTIAPASSTWITEVGVKVCAGGLPLVSDADQTARAHALNALLARYDPPRTYYYMMSGSANAANCGSGGKWDSGLIYDDPASPSVDGQPRPALAILFPELVGSWWALRDDNSDGPITRTVVFPRPGTPVAADWDADGRDSPGSFLNGSWWLRSAAGSGTQDNAFQYGDIGHQPVAGDWNRDGADTVGVFTPSNLFWHLRDENTAGSPTSSFTYGFSDGIALSGDWDGDGDDTIGLYRPSDLGFYLRNTNSAGIADILVNYGFPGGVPVVGDWNNDGVDTIGMFNPSTGLWYLRNSNTPGIAEITFAFGGPGDKPVVGDWNNDGRDTVGIVR